MTNLEKHMEDLIKLTLENYDKVLGSAIGVSDGTPHLCRDLHCNSCEFSGSWIDCEDQAMRWLHEEVEE